MSTARRAYRVLGSCPGCIACPSEAARAARIVRFIIMSCGNFLLSLLALAWSEMLVAPPYLYGFNTFHRYPFSARNLRRKYDLMEFKEEVLRPLLATLF